MIYDAIPPVDPELIAGLARFGTPDVHEAMGAGGGSPSLMTAAMQPLVRSWRAVGPAVTAEDIPGNNLMMHVALRDAGEGTVLVLTSGGGAQGALWGELATLAAQKRGIAGVVVDGNVRDVAALEALGFPVWATAISPLRSEKKARGRVNVPIVCAGVTVHPGDIVVADSDGVAIVRPHEAAAVIATAERRKAREDELRRRIADGERLFDLLGLDAALAGVERRPGHWSDGDA